MNNLVYYTVGYSASYIDITELSIRTLRMFGWSGDVMILCDESLAEQCKQRITGVIIHALPDSKSPQEASMRKLTIFDIPNIDRYDRVLFLDSDIIVHVDVSTVFSSIVDSGRLYVATESTNQEHHRHLFFSLENYTQQQLQHFKEQDIHVFNAGTFGFVRGHAMQGHLAAVREMIATHTGKFFYEQSFLNVYFNTRGITDRCVFSDQRYVFHHGDTLNHTGKLIHFCGNPGVGVEKMARMTAYLEKHITR
jgi:lipopolysaccharide biosynthesis glycosyltransferase